MSYSKLTITLLSITAATSRIGRAGHGCGQFIIFLQSQFVINSSWCSGPCSLCRFHQNCIDLRVFVYDTL